MHIDDKPSVQKVVATVIAGVVIIKFDPICCFIKLTYPQFAIFNLEGITTRRLLSLFTGAVSFIIHIEVFIEFLPQATAGTHVRWEKWAARSLFVYQCSSVFPEALCQAGPEFSVVTGYCFFTPGLRIILEVALFVFAHSVGHYIGRKRYLRPFFELYIEDQQNDSLGVELMFRVPSQFKIKPESLPVGDSNIKKETWSHFFILHMD